MNANRDFRASEPASFDSPHTLRRAVSIEDLIAAENDPKQRSFLIVLNSINNALLANTATVRDIKDSLDDHLQQYAKDAKVDEAWKNQGRGAWRVMAWVLGLAQAVLLAGGMALGSDLREIHSTITILHQLDAKLDNRIAVLEKKP